MGHKQLHRDDHAPFPPPYQGACLYVRIFACTYTFVCMFVCMYVFWITSSYLYFVHTRAASTKKSAFTGQLFIAPFLWNICENHWLNRPYIPPHRYTAVIDASFQIEPTPRQWMKSSKTNDTPWLATFNTHTEHKTAVQPGRQQQWRTGPMNSRPFPCSSLDRTTPKLRRTTIILIIILSSTCTRDKQQNTTGSNSATYACVSYAQGF